MLNAIIFDFDGVILDSEGLHYKVFNQVLKNVKFILPGKITKKDMLDIMTQMHKKAFKNNKELIKNY